MLIYNYKGFLPVSAFSPSLFGEKGCKSASYSDSYRLSGQHKLKMDGIRRQWTSGPVKRLAAVALGLFIVVTLLSNVGRDGQVAPYSYATDAGRSIPSRFSNMKGLAKNVFDYKGPKGTWPAAPLEVLKSPSPLVNTAPKREIDIASEPLPLEAPLEVRLDHWMASPGGRGPGVHLGLDGLPHEELELGDFNLLNRESCASVGHQMNTHMPQHAGHVWGTMNRTGVWEVRSQLVEWMRREVVQKNRTADYGEGRG